MKQMKLGQSLSQQLQKRVLSRPLTPALKIPVILIMMLSLLLPTAESFAKALSPDIIEKLKLVDNSLKVKASKNCGETYVLNKGQVEELGCDASKAELFIFSGGQRYSTKRKFPKFKKVVSTKPNFRTPEAQVFVHLPDNIKASAKNAEKVIDQLFAQELRKKIEDRFAVEVRLATELAEKTKDNKVLEYVETVKKLLFKDFEKKPKDQIRTFLTLYPDLITEIQDEVGSDLRPLLCRYELAKHRVKVLKKWSNILLVVALGLGASSIIVGSVGTAIPALAIAAGVGAVLVGARDVAFGLHNIAVKEKSANIAQQINKIAYTIKDTVKNLEKKKAKLEKEKGKLSDDEEVLLGVLKDIEKDISKGRRKKLKKLHRAKHINRIVIACGILNAGFNSVNFSGDPELLTKLPGMLIDLLKGK